MSEPNENERYVNHVEEVIKAEKARIFGEQKAADTSEKKTSQRNIFGLAISGGGIRSASFGMGLLQALVEVDILKEIHYLSTVSGGGYIGSSLTWFLNKGRPDPNGGEPLPAGTTKSNFPFGKKGVGDRMKADGNEILDFIRQHGNYLTPDKGLGAVSLAGVVFRSTFVSLLVYFSLLVFIMGVLIVFKMFGDQQVMDLGNVLYFNVFSTYSIPFWAPFSENWLLNLFAYTIIFIFLFAIVYSFSTRSHTGYGWLLKAQRLGGKLWIMAFALAAIGALPWFSELVYSKTIASSSGIGGIALGLYEQFRKRSPEDKDGPLSTVRILLGVAGIIYGLLVFSYMTASFFEFSSNLLLLLIPFAITLIVGLCVNLNIFGLHRMYRDRLMETFMANGKNIVENKWGPATDANVGYLKEMCAKDKNPKPYHIINTNLVTTDSPKSKFKGRGGDNFILSPIYCGCDATGWETTKTYRSQRPGNKGITLPTAMAISGAAVNPSAGPNGQGLTKNRLVSILLGLLNIQMGFWSDNPNRERKGGLKLPTNFITPGLTGNVLGIDLSEESEALLLTDGGHFENLGLYELIRRKLKVIIASDAGCDPDFKFEDLTNLIEKVRVDFGTKIVFDEEYDLKGLIPGEVDEADAEMGDKIELARRGFAIAKIYYSTEGKNEEKIEGTLIYLKTTLTNSLPKDLYGYKLNNPSYPDETTVDQFFSEVQFEAYRELGFQLGIKDWPILFKKMAGLKQPTA